MPDMSRIRAARPVVIALAAVAAAGLGLAAAGPASAHSTLVDSTPEAGETLTTLPPTFSATFNEDLLDASGTGEGFVLQIVGPGGTHYENGRVSIDGPTLSTDAIVGPPGDYELDYRVVSADGHPVEGRIPFTWSSGPGDATPMPTESDEPADEPGDAATAVPISAPAPAPPGGPPWLAGAIAAALLLGGGIVAAAVRRRR